MESKKLKTMIFLLFLPLIMLIKSCDKEEISYCDALSYYGSSDSTNMLGNWSLECFAKINKSGKIDCIEYVDHIKLTFSENEISTRVYNDIKGSYAFLDLNGIEINAETITYIAVHDPLEGEYIHALNAAECIAISDYNIMIYFKYPLNNKSNVLKFKK